MHILVTCVIRNLRYLVHQICLKKKKKERLRAKIHVWRGKWLREKKEIKRTNIHKLYKYIYTCKEQSQKSEKKNMLIQPEIPKDKHKQTESERIRLKKIYKKTFSLRLRKMLGPSLSELNWIKLTCVLYI